MSECDPACRKIIVNSGLIAILAGLLAKITDSGTSLQSAAQRLADVTQAIIHAHDLLVRHGALVITKEFAATDWNGCEDAVSVAVILADLDRGLESAAAVSQLSDLQAHYLDHLHILVSGNLR